MRGYSLHNNNSQPKIFILEDFINLTSHISKIEDYSEKRNRIYQFFEEYKYGIQTFIGDREESFICLINSLSMNYFTQAFWNSEDIKSELTKHLDLHADLSVLGDCTMHLSIQNMDKKSKQRFNISYINENEKIIPVIEPIND